MSVQRVQLNKEFAYALMKCFDNKHGELLLEIWERELEAQLPDYENVNKTYGIAGAYKFVKRIRQRLKTAKEEGENDRENRPDKPSPTKQS